MHSEDGAGRPFFIVALDVVRLATGLVGATRRLAVVSFSAVFLELRLGLQRTAVRKQLTVAHADFSNYHLRCRYWLGSQLAS